MKVYAFVGKSGSGKSHRAQMVAKEYGLNYIIDDAILIKDNKVLAGKSAKKADTKIASVRQALFSSPGQKEEIDRVRKKEEIDSILILGTSDGMVKKIAANLGLPEVSDITYINEVATEEEMHEYCMALPRYKRPKKIILADIPRNATGKIQKNALRERYGASRLVEAETTK